jgi:hypothetical protein
VRHDLVWAASPVAQALSAVFCPKISSRQFAPMGLTLGAVSKRTFWLAALVLSGGALLGAPREVVVLRGGTRMELSAPMMRQGNIVLLTRSDGTIFSVPASEIDFAATAAAKAAPQAPPANPAITTPPSSPVEAARLNRPKARVRITDDDVAHTQESSSPESDKKKGAGGSTPARVEVGEYSQQKTGDQLTIHGVLRNVGASNATGTRIAVAALGDKGETIASSEGTLSGGTIEPGQEVDFSASLKVGQKTVASLRFSPLWTPTAPPAPADTAPRPAAGNPASSSDSMSSEPSRAPAAPPAPAPTPYGQGVLYAPPSASAKTEPPADGKNGYIPGATRKEDQPKPPQ